MAIEKVVKISVDQVQASGGLDKFVEGLSNTENKAQSLRAELKSLKQQLAELPEGTAKYQEIAKRAGEVSDKIGDISTRVKNLGSDTKNIDAVVQGAQTLSGAFTVASSASALFGQENEDLQKSMQKVEAAIGLTVGIQSIANALQKESALYIGITNVATKVQIGLQRAWAIATEATTSATAALKATLLTTGIGAVVVALGYLISKLNDSSEATKELTADQKAYNDELKDFKDITDDAVKSIDYATKLDLENAKQRGASEKELLKIKLDGLVLISKKNREEAERIIAQQDKDYLRTKEQNARLQQLREENQDLQRQGNLLIAQYETELAEKQRENQKKNAEDAKASAKKREEERKAELERLYNLEQAWLKKQNDLELSVLDEIDKAKKANDDFKKSAQQVEIDDITEKYQKQIDLAVQFGKDTTDLETARANEINDINLKYQQKSYKNQADADLQNANDKDLSFKDRLAAVEDREELEKDIVFGSEKEKTDYEKANADARKEIAKEEQAAKAAILEQASKTIAQAGALAGEHTALGKTLAVAGATIDTYRSAVSAYNGMTEAIPGPVGIAAGIAAAALSVATGLANVKKILSVKVPNAKGGASGSVPTGGGATAPSFNIVGQNTNNQLAQTIAQKQQQPVEAYVVSGNVSNAQSLDRNRVSTATFN